MTNVEILEMVKKSLADVVPGFDLSKVAEASTFVDLGVGSLQFVEVVAKSMRALRVKVPRSDIGKIRTVAALVDALARAPAKT